MEDGDTHGLSYLPPAAENCVCGMEPSYLSVRLIEQGEPQRLSLFVSPPGKSSAMACVLLSRC